MKLIYTFIVMILFLSCKEMPEKTVSEKAETAGQQFASEESTHPDELIKVFDAHGGLRHWRDKRTLTFEIPKPEAREIHTIDLHTRRDRIELPQATLGFDGQNIWLSDDGGYKGDAAMYHNLMFYFYAMPFVFADENINYRTAEELEFEGRKYPGFHITFDEGVGASPKDEYYLHYDPDTHQMVWLGYTFTYGSGERSDNVRWIRYEEWMPVDDIVLPKSITWYDYEDRRIKQPKNTVAFDNVSVSEMSKPDSFFAGPENAVIVNPKG